MDIKTRAREIAELIYRKETCVSARTDGIPYTAHNGRWDDMTQKDVNWWTNGFWGGLLWQLYGAFGNKQMRRAAEDIEVKLDKNLACARGMDHDSGFKWLLTSGANLRITSNPESRNRILLAADNLAGRFNPIGKFIRAWNDGGDGSKAGWAIIDCMMNLPLLYYASSLTADPRYAHIAACHARTAAAEFVRADGSVCHIVEFDPVSGRRLRSIGGQGYDENSAWTRGQAWALYGFTLSYIHTQNGGFLDAARKCARYFISRIPSCGIIPIDFCREDGEDCSAAAIAACGLIELHKITDGGEYLRAADKLLSALIENRCDFGENSDFIVTGCAVDYRGGERGIPLVYADYFFTEAILKLCGKESFLW